MIANGASPDRANGDRAQQRSEQPDQPQAGGPLRSLWRHQKLLFWIAIGIVLVYKASTVGNGTIVTTGADLGVGEIMFGPLDATLADRATGQPVTCLSAGQTGLTIFVRLDRHDRWGIDNPRSTLRLVGRTSDDRPAEVMDLRQPLGRIRRIRNTERIEPRWYAWHIPLEHRLQGRTIIWSATVEHPDDQNRANDTLSDVSIAPCHLSARVAETPRPSPRHAPAWTTG